MDFKIKGKTALVLGSSSGLGYAIAQALIQEGVKVAVSSRDENKLDRAARELGAPLAIPSDLTQPGAGTLLVRKVIAAFDGIDILVTNTGGPPKGNFDELNPSQWQSGFQSVWMSAVDAIQACLPGMKDRQWGRILLVTSAAAKEPIPHLTVSNGLRAGLLGLTKSLCHEVASHGITVNALLPGYINTDRLKELGVPAEQMAAKIPAGRLGTPEELAALVAFLASDPARYITGQAIACDGGYLKGL